MKPPIKTIALLLLFSTFSLAEEISAESVLEKHTEAASEIADRQDELSADAQQLTIEQTVPKVIELLTSVEDIMDEATDNLSAADTGGKTIAAQTEIIEKIYEAAKARQQQQGSGKSGSAMMEMMERMMGKTPEGEQKGKGKGDQPGDQAGGGANGSSDTANELAAGLSSGNSEVRKVPKASGTSGHALPEEFRKALDAYNQGAEKKLK